MLPRLRAEDQLARLNAAAYPHMERAEARAYARSIEDAAGVERVVVKPTRAAFQAMGIQTN